MPEICNDNRFELIEKYKRELCEHTNIKKCEDEMGILKVNLLEERKYIVEG